MLWVVRALVQAIITHAVETPRPTTVCRLDGVGLLPLAESHVGVPGFPWLFHVRVLYCVPYTLVRVVFC